MSVEITVYSKPSCVQCEATYRALKQNNISYRVIDISQDDEALKHVRRLGHMQAPVVETPSGHWSGYRPDRIKELASIFA